MIHVKTGLYNGENNFKALEFPYETDHFQKHAFEAIEKGQHLLVTAHTGSGKTTVAEYAIAYALKQGKKVIYTAPIKALSNQVYNDFRKKYPSWDVGIRTGDIDLRSDAQIVIMTTEIIRNMLFKGNINAGLVIFDEVHYIKDHDRGSVWEESIVMMPEDIQMVLLSATLPDALEFSKWIAECKGRDICYTTTDRRVVPLTHYVMTGTGNSDMLKILDNEGHFYSEAYSKALKEYNFVPSMLNKYCKVMPLPALFFCFSRAKCEQYAKEIHISLVDATEAVAIEHEYKTLLRKFDPVFEFIPQVQELHNLLVKGVGYHHAGILPPLKEIVQELFTKGHIKILFVTETFAAGVNMPAKTVVFTGLSKYDTPTNGFRTLYPEEYRQMAGRAGRRGLDTIGTVILLPFRTGDLLSQHEMKDLLCGPVRNIISRLKLDFPYILKSITGGKSLRTCLDKTLLSKQNHEDCMKSQIRLKELEDKYTILCSNSFDKDTEAILEQHNNYVNKLLVGKYTKLYHKDVLSWKQTHPTLSIDAVYLQYKEQLSCKSAIKEEKKVVMYNQNYITEELSIGLKFLATYGYIQTFRDNIDEYVPSDVTILGVACTEANEVDSLLLVQCISHGIFDDVDEKHLIALLSVFIGDGLECRETSNKKVDMIYNLKEEIEKDMSTYGFYSNIVLSDEYYNIVYNWVSCVQEKKDMEYICTGEFVKAMLKLNNICDEVIDIAKILQKDLLMKSLENHKSLIIHGIVTPQSLYCL